MNNFDKQIRFWASLVNESEDQPMGAEVNPMSDAYYDYGRYDDDDNYTPSFKLSTEEEKKLKNLWGILTRWSGSYDKNQKIEFHDVGDCILVGIAPGCGEHEFETLTEKLKKFIQNDPSLNKQFKYVTYCDSEGHDGIYIRRDNLSETVNSDTYDTLMEEVENLKSRIECLKGREC